MNHGPLKIERGVASPLIAGVELGGTKCICTLGSGPGEIVAEARIATTTPEQTLSAIEDTIDGWVRDHAVAAIGIASFGPLELDPRADHFGYISATTKPGWRGTSVAKRFSHRYALPIAFDTDVVGAALGEARWGAAMDLTTFAYVTVGTGIGAGIIINGQPVRGRGHPELGHIHVRRRPGDAWPGACPYHGDCVEGLAAGYAIAKRTGRVASDIPGHDPCWHSVAHAIAGLCHNLVLTVAPEAILIGGGVVTGQPHLLERIRFALVESLAGYGSTDTIARDIDTFVLTPGLGERAGPLGSLALGASALLEDAGSTPWAPATKDTVSLTI